MLLAGPFELDERSVSEHDPGWDHVHHLDSTARRQQAADRQRRAAATFSAASVTRTAKPAVQLSTFSQGEHPLELATLPASEQADSPGSHQTERMGKPGPA
jgi:hypothetical protein